MTKRYSVFVSSTYEDLKEERKEVIQALLELDCIPIGMELFPATDDDQWTLIQELIEDSDYYILIIGGRYGSMNKKGISYTQMEYEYAVSIGVPVISFIPKHPDQIVTGKTDKSSEKENKLKEFKTLVSEKMIKFWNTPEELGSVVSRSLVKLIKSKPRIGWVKADQISSDQANLEILELKQKVYELEEKLKISLETENSNLIQDNDLFKVMYVYKLNGIGRYLTDFMEIPFNNLFSKTCSILIDEGKESELKSFISAYIAHLLLEKSPEKKDINIIDDNFMSIIIQLKALGLIEKSIRKRSLKDSGTYWQLTPKGDTLITNLRAKTKIPNSSDLPPTIT
ncbi:hypothetical protein B0A69_10255 [Chryseobacterium shigense]|uniref:DUF4062 domain-containing protein n=1 Tax=Chryseobacterium shigense TaxID=297244 RepID=A0A1N7HY78_9FLAO|nr:DUF4062 domain-containing protein [Chryseobacterium shigense]PQA93970.1 hypothetical protein B0A69_10255 [Chryseobacterium shigense]SIS29680.1 protein of unknown function [Chryseobacterium shigense]